jgi:hypothetical protein
MPAAVVLRFLSFHSPTAARPPVFHPTSIVLWDNVSANRLGNGSELKTKTANQRNAQRLKKKDGLARVNLTTPPMASRAAVISE